MHRILTTLRDLPMVALFALFIATVFAGWIWLPIVGWFLWGWWGTAAGVCVWWLAVSVWHATGFEEVA